MCTNKKGFLIYLYQIYIVYQKSIKVVSEHLSTLMTRNYTLSLFSKINQFIVVILILAMLHFGYNTFMPPSSYTQKFYLLKQWVSVWINFYIALSIIPFILTAIVIQFILQHRINSTDKIQNGNLEQKITKKQKSLQINKFHSLILVYFSVVVVLLSILVTLMISYRIPYGPIVMPTANGTNIVWGTSSRTEELIEAQVDNQSLFFCRKYSEETLNYSRVPHELPKRFFHSVFIPSNNFNFTLNNKNYSVNYKNPKKFVIVTDVHQQQDYIASLKNYEYDALLSVGDATAYGLEREYQDFFEKMDARPLVFALGNHDARTGFWRKILQREHNYVQVMGDIAFFVIYPMDHKILVRTGDPTKAEVDETIIFLRENFEKHRDVRHKFILTHLPIYTAALPDGVEYYQKQMEKLLAESERYQIRAVFSGHDHVFSSFLFNKIYHFVAGVHGGCIAALFDGSTEMHGKFDGFGGDYHLDSYGNSNWFMKLDVEETKIKYKIINSNDSKLILEYIQDV